ncbi:hypothetical protein Ndes2526B_g09123 [Nannochloris sp. 'desiccata']|nr:hypothetical protein KSW81_001331 [Chlorella desiccata (nom. nud.)]KAH7617016.1 putative E3 ubiquitin-protein ligase LIN-1 [Chlorella desiccata (nom. nud.)]
MPSSLRSLPPRGNPSNLSKIEEDDAALFEAPSELVCPITHAVFFDPVLTQAGHAYERKSIEQHLRTTDTDPMSRQPLLNPSLTPVFVLKSRALEYRESTSRLCVDRACSVSPPRPPIDYLRRAVELCSDVRFLPKGLTSEVVTYVNSHLSNVYDRLALNLFAGGLLENGYRDRAAAVYFHLLLTEEDKSAQASILKRCLACWQAGGTAPRSGENTSTSSTDGGGDYTSGDFNSTPSYKDVDGHVFEKLVQMIDTKESHFGWLIEVSSEAGLGNRFLARLCEQILFPQRMAVFPSTSSLSASSSSGLDSTSMVVASPRARVKRQGSLPWETEKEVLLKYCFVLTAGVKEEHAELNNRIASLEEKLSANRRGRRGGKFNRLWLSASSNDLNNGGTENKDDDDDDDDGRGCSSEEHSGGDGNDFIRPLGNALMVLKRVVRHPFLMVPCAAIAVLGDPHNPLVRSTFVLPFLALMHHSSGGSRSGTWRGGRFSSVEMPQAPSGEEAEGEGESNTESTPADFTKKEIE